MIKSKTLKVLEYDKILDMLSKKAESKRARDIILSYTPSPSFEYALTLQQETSEAYDILFNFSLNPSFSVDDISVILQSARKMSLLSMADLLKIARVLRVARNLKTTVFKAETSKIPLIKSYVDGIYTNQNLELDIEKSILSETEMSDYASKELKSVRDAIKRQNEKIRQKLNSYVTSSAYQKALQDNIVTIRKDRFVLPVKSEYKNMIDGIVHDESSSGATVYIEPMAIVNLNNEIVSLKVQEQAEIVKVLQAFTVVVSGESETIERNFDIITSLDVIFAKAKLGKEMKGNMPILNNDGKINIIRGRHPLIDKNKVMPISVNLGIDFDMLVITGPNTGGKTVTLKLVGLFTLMALSGMLLPLEEDSTLSYFEAVNCDIGDEQSIEQSLSTFSSHLKNIVDIVDNVNDKSLLLFDELGAGTDPSEGAALALAISEYVLKSGAKAIVTSHYNELKEYSMITNRVENASMDFNPITFEPIYKLIIGVAGSSNALQIAKRLGLKEEIIELANSKISSDKKEFDNIIKTAHKTKKEAEYYLEEIYKDRQEEKELLAKIKEDREKLIKSQEELNNKIRKDSKTLIEDAVSEAEEIIDEMKKLLSKPTEQNIFTARKLKKQLENMSVKYEDKVEAEYVEDTSPIIVGSTVLLKSLGKEGVVESINASKNSVRLKLGNITMDAKMHEIVKIKANKPAKKKVVNVSKEFSNESVKTELNVIGSTVDEAIIEVDNFIDRASTAGATELRIIHGKGTGRLRKGIQDRLKKHPQVKSFRNGGYGEGETGVTIVTLK